MTPLRSSRDRAHPAGAARRTRSWVWLGLVPACVAWVVACSPGEDATEAAAASAANRPPEARGVRVVRVEERELEDRIEVTGELLARTVVDLSPLGSGQLIGLRLDEGDRVRAGDIVAQLDDETEAARRRELDAQLASARARARTAAAALEEHERELARRRTLVERGALVAAELERWTDQLPRIQNEVRVTEATVEEIRTTQRTAALEQRRRTIRAPFDGLVITRHVVDGAMVTPQTPVLTLLDESSIEWVVRVHEERIGQLDAGAVARARADAYPDRLFEGRIVRRGAVVDREARTVELGVRLDVEPGILRHGMFVRGELVVSSAERLPSLPVEALTVTSGVTSVLVVDDGVVQRLEVDVAFRTRRHAALRGIPTGTVVVLQGPPGLTEGEPVVVIGEGAAAVGESG